MGLAMGLALGLSFGAQSSCSSTKGKNSEDAKAASPANDPRKASPGAGPSAPTPGELKAPPLVRSSLRLHPVGFAWAFESGKEPYKIALDEAEAKGFRLFDLSDNWVPYIFSEQTPGLEDFKKNRYAKLYRGLANDKLDADGDKLPAHANNYLELFGIPPTLTVLRKEWKAAESTLQQCLDEAGYNKEVFANFTGKVEYKHKRGAHRLRQVKRAEKSLLKAMRKARIAKNDFEKAAAHPKTQAVYNKWKGLEDSINVIKNAQIRLSCERLFPTRRGKGNSKAGVFDGEVAMALAEFERKHNQRGWGHFSRKNIELLAKSAPEAVYERLLRVIKERAISGAGVVEDGSAAAWKPKFQWTDAAGQKQPLRDVATEQFEALKNALGMLDFESAKSTLDKLATLNEDGFAQLLVAVKTPDLPEYYSESMDFSAVIHRGDVWYEFPYNDEGELRNFPRRRFPYLTVFTTYRDQRIPLVRWRTTIGSWFREEHDGKLYLMYKNSDIGPRVWKDIIAAPVWVPPRVTPTKALVKTKFRRGKRYRVVNYERTGPSYTSAYGLVAAYHIRQVKDEAGNILREIDNQIRTHGSVDYMSIMRRYSHGCHRLYNMSAVQLFSFILQHRHATRHGQLPLGYKREFEYEEEEFTMELPTRGYRYELNEPIPINVLEGRIRGKQKRPMKEAMLIPGMDYSDTGTEDTGIGDTEGLGPGTGGATGGTGMAGAVDGGDAAAADLTATEPKAEPNPPLPPPTPGQ